MLVKYHSSRSNIRRVFTALSSNSRLILIERNSLLGSILGTQNQCLSRFVYVECESMRFFAGPVQSSQVQSRQAVLQLNLVHFSLTLHCTYSRMLLRTLHLFFVFLLSAFAVAHDYRSNGSN